MDGHVPQNGDTVLLGDSLGFMLIPSFLHLNAKLCADLPVHMCSCLVVVVHVFSFSQLRGVRDRVVNGLIKTDVIMPLLWFRWRIVFHDFMFSLMNRVIIGQIL